MREKRAKRGLHELQFNVAQLLKEGTGATRRYDVTAEAGTKLDEDVMTVASLTGHVKFLRTGPNILVTGLLETTIQKACGRCLNVFSTPVSVELEEEFFPVIDIVTGAVLPEQSDVEQTNLIDEQHILDMSEAVRQELVLAGDGILYCRADCKGLCPRCGQDQNISPCDCRENEIDARWAGLQALQLEDQR